MAGGLGGLGWTAGGGGAGGGSSGNSIRMPHCLCRPSAVTWPSAKDLFKSTSSQSMLSPWLLWTVKAHASIRGICVRVMIPRQGHTLEKS